MSGAVAASVVANRTLKNLKFAAEEVLVDETFASDTGQFSQFSLGNAGSFALSGGAGVVTNTTGSQKDRFVRVAGVALDGPVAWLQVDVTAVTGSPNNWNIGCLGFAKDSTHYVLAEHDAKNNQTRLEFNFGGVTATKLFTNTLTAPFQLALSIYRQRLTVYYDDGNGENWQTAIAYEIPVATIDLDAVDFTGWLPTVGASSSDNATCTWSFDNLKAYPGRIDYCEFAPPALTLFSDGFSADTGQLTASGTSPATVTISGGQLSLVDAGSGTTFAIFTGQSEMLMPQLFAEIDVVSQSTAVGRVGVGVAADSTHYIFARYSRVETDLELIVNTGSGEVVLGEINFVAGTLGVPGGTGSPPFKLALSVVGPIAVVWIDEGNGWWPATSANVTGSFDTLALLKSGGGYKPALYMSNTGACTYVLDNFRIGRFGGVGIRDMILATEEDGTPIKVGDEWLFCATVNDSKVGGSTGVFTLDPETRYLTQVGAIMVDRSSKVYNDLGCHLIRDANNDWRILIATWGNGFGGSLEIISKLETSLDLSSGSHVVSSLVQLDLQELDGVGGSGRYQATAVKRDGVWYVNYDVTEATDFSANFYPAVDTSSDMSTFTALGADDGSTEHEGSHFNILDGRIWFITGGFTHARCYDAVLNFLQNLDAPSSAFDGGSDTLPHSVIFALDDDTVLLVTHDRRKKWNGSFSWGGFRLFEAPRHK
jgi:hypothetical protein